jgi:hypothetical protein
MAEENAEKEDSKFKAVYSIATGLLQIMSFIFLFNFHSSKYIVYIFSFILFSVTPFLWINEISAMGPMLNSNSRYHTLFQFKQMALFVSYALVFIGMFMVLLTNETVRRGRVSEDQPLDSLHVNDHKSKSDQTILILYTIIVPLMWGLVLETFSDSETFGKKKMPGEENTGFGSVVAWMLNQPAMLFHNIDSSLHNMTDSLSAMSPLIKFFVFYCVTFIVTIFAIFIRIPLGVPAIEDQSVRYEKMKIVNIGNIFNQFFHDNVNSYRDTALIFTGLLLIFILYCALQSLVFISEMYSSYDISIIKKALFVPLSIAIGLGIMYVRGKMTVLEVKRLIMFLLSVIFSGLGTPLIFGLMQITGEIFSKTFISSILKYVISIPFFVFVFLTMWITVFMNGLYWISQDAFKNLRIFNAVLVCMGVSTFVGLSPTYNMFSNLYRFLKFLTEGFTVYLAPLVIVALSTALVVYAYRANVTGYIKTNG